MGQRDRIDHLVDRLAEMPAVEQVDPLADASFCAAFGQYDQPRAGNMRSCWSYLVVMSRGCWISTRLADLLGAHTARAAASRWSLTKRSD